MARFDGGMACAPREDGYTDIFITALLGGKLMRF